MFEIPFASTLYKCDWLTDCASAKRREDTKRKHSVCWRQTEAKQYFAIHPAYASNTFCKLVTASHLEQTETLIIDWPSTFLRRWLFFNIHLAHVRLRQWTRIENYCQNDGKYTIRNKGTTTHTHHISHFRKCEWRWLGLKIEYIYAKPHARNNIQNDIFIRISLSLFESFYRFIASHFPLHLFSLRFFDQGFACKNRERMNKEKEQKKMFEAAKSETMMKEKIWAAVAIFSVSISSNSIIAMFSASPYFMANCEHSIIHTCVWHSNILHNLFSHCNFPWSTLNFNQCVCKTASLLWIRDGKSIDIN